MPVVLLDYAAAGAGKVSLINYDGTSEALDLPTNVAPTLERASFAESTRSESRLYIAGGLNDNCMITDQRVLLRQYITPISQPIIESAAPANYQIGLEQIAGSGLTGDCIFFFRWYDSIHKRRSAFSAGSPTLALSGAESVKIYNMPAGPDQADAFVDCFEVWVNRNGELDARGRSVIRRLARRTVGASTYTITEAIEYEAEEEYGLTRLPRVLYNAIYHGRKWSSGDAAHPERIYFSPIERYDEYTNDSFLETLNGEPVRGLVKVRDVLVVLCPESSYYITGYSETDFEVNSLEPHIGCITHHGIKMIHDIAAIPSHQGLYACTGTSMRLLDGDYATAWTEKYNANPLGFENGFGITDTRSKVYKFYEESVTVSQGVPTYGVGRFWVFDYKNFSEEEGGSFAPPFLSYDLYADRVRCAAMVAPPGSPSSNCYQGFLNKRIAAENNWAALDLDGSRTTKIQIPIIKAEPGGGPNDGLKFLEGWMYVCARSFDSWQLEMTHGPDRSAIRDTYAWIIQQITGMPLADPGKTIEPAWANWAWNYEIASITRVGATATVTTVKNHNFTSGEVHTISGADQAEYNGAQTVTVTGLKTFEFTVGGTPATPATGTMLVTGQVDQFSPEAVPFRIELSGDGLSLILSVVNPIGLIWAGYGFTSTAGKKLLAGSQ